MATREMKDFKLDNVFAKQLHLFGRAMKGFTVFPALLPAGIRGPLSQKAGVSRSTEGASTMGGCLYESLCSGFWCIF